MPTTKKYSDDEVRQRKNARQKEYEKRSGYKAIHEYDKKTYTQIKFRERKDIAELYKAKCAKLGISLSEPLHKAIQDFLESE